MSLAAGQLSMHMHLCTYRTCAYCAGGTDILYYILGIGMTKFQIIEQKIQRSAGVEPKHPAINDNF